ncbi:MAG TPA: PilZ domain-containing protein [Terriglobales bacterium]|nr:PilZ domain-containing protein [Terriglobales bacterium]
MNQEASSQVPERQSKRVQVALPIRVTYWDVAHKPALEIACTYDISEHGARVTGLRCVKETGEIIAIERGKSKAFCRVVWIGEPNSELRGQIGIQCVESDRTLWEAELRDMHEVYDPIVVEGTGKPGGFGSHERRRRRERFILEGTAELTQSGPKGVHAKGALKNVSEIGCLVSTKQIVLPGTELKLTLNIGDYSLALKGQVRHADSHGGLGIEFHEIRKGERQILQFLLRKLADKHFEDTLQFEINR